MANPQTQHHIEKKEVHKEKGNDYKGTFMSVMLLGGFLILSWVGVWILYLIR
ncbi:cytochrome c oxidase subunit 2A [Virgibacillus sp. MSJ-26]|uniref:cytochrome c oxidase subunit 2A n=1 Tax=Virgibacillus sp. MSJ-26 TaxID=2841522 RepID=UPI00209D15C1|nr:cytochrome c oxidase subunit 2A [Virgibacillus sp. MSJ-26]